MSDILQPYDNSYTGGNIYAPKVRVGGQLYYLISGPESLSLQQVSSQSTQPYVYPYGMISGIYPVGNEYYEPCIEVNISYENGESAAMVMVFDSEEERNSALSMIQHHSGSIGYSDFRQPDADYSQSYESESGFGQCYDKHYAGQYDDSDDYGASSGYDSYDSGYSQSFEEYKYSHGDLSLIEKVKGFLRYPGETFESVSQDQLLSGVIYAFLMLAIFSVVNVLISGLIASSIAPDNAVYGILLKNIPELVRLILEYFIFGALCIIIYGILVFLLTKITGQGIDASESLLTTFYSSTAIGTIGLIPLFGIFLGPLWMVFLQIKGLCSGYDADVKWAAVSAVVPAVLMFVLFYYVVVSGEVAFI